MSNHNFHTSNHFVRQAITAVDHLLIGNPREGIAPLNLDEAIALIHYTATPAGSRAELDGTFARGWRYDIAKQTLPAIQALTLGNPKKGEPELSLPAALGVLRDKVAEQGLQLA